MLLPTDLIVYFESHNHAMYIFVNENGTLTKYVTRMTFDEIGDFENEMMCRTHRTYMVNLDYVDSIRRYNLELRNGFGILPIGQGRYMEVKKIFHSYKK